VENGKGVRKKKRKKSIVSAWGKLDSVETKKKRAGERKILRAPRNKAFFCIYTEINAGFT